MIHCGFDNALVCFSYDFHGKKGLCRCFRALLCGELNVDDEGCRGDSTNNAAGQGVSQPGGFDDVDLRELVTQLLTDFGHRGESGEFVEAGSTQEETQTEAANRGDKVVRVSIPT